MNIVVETAFSLNQGFKDRSGLRRTSMDFRRTSWISKFPEVRSPTTKSIDKNYEVRDDLNGTETRLLKI